MIRRVALVALLTLGASASAGQSAQRAEPSSRSQRQGAPAQPVAPPRSPSDIIVNGVRGLDDPASAVTHETLGSSRTGIGARRSGEAMAVSLRYAKCAVRANGGAHDWLRRTLDGIIDGASQRFAQSRFVQIKSTCAQDAAFATQTGFATAANGVDTSYYDRGALFIRAVQVFAPGLDLTAAQTGDRAVQARFNAREIPLAAARLPTDREYFEMAVCFVRVQPEASVDLVMLDDPDRVARTEARIVNGARECAGGAREVVFDAAQLRAYVADAVYRWTVAARGVDTLIPD